MLVKPKHYDKFKCVASACTDTCCAGWEIDVDTDTADLYASLEGEVGGFVSEKLICTPDGQKLCLEGERCRFLREDNLCELILRLGEDALCDICREHPRFYTYFGGITEMGVGLCCPEGARLWLDEAFELTSEADGEQADGEAVLELERQKEILGLLADEDLSLGEILASLMDDDDSDGLYPELRRLYSSIEVLDEGFPKRFAEQPVTVTDRRMRRLAAYFVFRYFFELGEELTIKFTAASLIMIGAMGGELAESCKDYSKEVEYDTDNVDRICAFVSDSLGLAELCRRVLVC